MLVSSHLSNYSR